MPAYFIAQIDVHDPIEYQNYLDGFMPIFQRHQGELLVTSSSKTHILEGEWEYPSTVLLRFPSTEVAKNWYSDPEYQALTKHRHNAAHTNFVLVEGLS